MDICLSLSFRLSLPQSLPFHLFVSSSLPYSLPIFLTPYIPHSILFLPSIHLAIHPIYVLIPMFFPHSLLLVFLSSHLSASPSAFPLIPAYLHVSLPSLSSVTPLQPVTLPAFLTPFSLPASPSVCLSLCLPFLPSLPSALPPLPQLPVSHSTRPSSLILDPQ